jgi:hypothetical protein
VVARKPGAGSRDMARRLTASRDRVLAYTVKAAAPGAR